MLVVFRGEKVSGYYKDNLIEGKSYKVMDNHDYGDGVTYYAIVNEKDIQVYYSEHLFDKRIELRNIILNNILNEI